MMIKKKTSKSATQDFSGGLAPERDYPLTRQPADEPTLGENHAFWMLDKQVFIFMHLNTLDHVGAYDLRHGKLSMVFPNGRVLVQDEDGGPTTEKRVSSGNLFFRCDEPFKKWTCGFHGTMRDVTTPRQIWGDLHPGPSIVVDFEITCVPVAPPWVLGSFTPGGLGPVKNYVGGSRYEQLTHNTGRLRVGDREITIDSNGNRTHRCGTRAIGPMQGHCWGAAIFPSGAGFAYKYFPTAEGSVLWGEGYLLQEGKLVAARATHLPWLKSFLPAGEKFTVELESLGKSVLIEGETLGSLAFVMVPGKTADDDVIISQSWVRYVLNGETTISMMERSLRRSEINK